MRVLVIIAHPLGDSFAAVLPDTVVESAESRPPHGRPLRSTRKASRPVGA